MKKKDTVRVSFIGNNAENVTGSCTRIEFREQVILFDFGLIQQGNTILENYKLNKSFLRTVRPSEIDAIIISHLHADHVALLPWLYKNGCTAATYVALNSSSIMNEMLLDCAHINERDAETLTNMYEKKFDPLYTACDVEKTMQYVREVPEHEKTNILDGVDITFIPNGHILRSMQCTITFDTQPVNKRLTFTGDLGNLTTLKSKYYIEPFESIEKTDYLIAESTYGLNSRNNKKDYKKDIEKIKSVITQFCGDMNGRVLIPTFSLDRMPFFMSLLYDSFHNDPDFKYNIYIDSPLANRLLNCYSAILSGEKKQHFDEVMAWKNFKYIVSPEDSIAAIKSPTPKVILSSSGMLTQGRSFHWLKSVITRPNDCVCFCGYCGKDTLGYKIKNNQMHKTVNIQGKAYKNNAAIIDLKSFSGHMQHQDLVQYYSHISAKKIYLVHGDADAKLQLKEDLETELHKQCRTTQVVATNKSTSFTIQ